MLKLFARPKGLPSIHTSAFVPACNLKLNTKTKGPFTHVIAGLGEAHYYLTGPQQARPPEGKFKRGTRIKLLRNAGSYCVVQSETGITAHVATGALKPIKKD